MGQICKDDGKIRLLRNTVFSKLQLDKMKEFQDVFYDPSLSQFVGEVGDKNDNKYPGNYDNSHSYIYDCNNIHM